MAMLGLWIGSEEGTLIAVEPVWDDWSGAYVGSKVERENALDKKLRCDDLPVMVLLCKHALVRPSQPLLWPVL